MGLQPDFLNVAMRMQFYAIEIARSVLLGVFMLAEADLEQKPRRPE